MKERITFNNGVREGSRTAWWKNGKKKWHSLSAKDKLHGPYKRWDANGQLLETGAYQEGKKHGHFVRYNDGKKVWEGDFRKGVAHGVALNQNNPDKKWWNQEVALDLRLFEVDLPIWQAAIVLAGLLLVIFVVPWFWRKKKGSVAASG
jgi:hypothetical protein